MVAFIFLAILVVQCLKKTKFETAIKTFSQ